MTASQSRFSGHVYFRGPRLFMHNCKVERRKQFWIILIERPENSKPNPSLTLMLTPLLTLTLYPNPNYMPLNYVDHKCITTPLAMTSLGTPNLHSSRDSLIMYGLKRLILRSLTHKKNMLIKVLLRPMRFCDSALYLSKRTTETCTTLCTAISPA